MTELISKDVSHTVLHFEGNFDSEGPSERLVLVELTFIDGLVHLIGRSEYVEIIPDASAYSLDAIAVMVTEP
jgi:ABC-type Fe3+-citrate transport system substrate-binding protein